MAERKVLIKYFPKNFDHTRIVKRGRGKDKLMMVRNMLPMSLRCNICSNYLYIGTKFNMRMQICNEDTYLGIKMFRFYFKCTYCYGQITFVTDPKNHDYIVQTGGTRNYQAIKDAQHAQKVMKRLQSNQKEENSMRYLENKSYDSKREMDIMEALEDVKNLNKRQAVIDPEDLLQTLIYEEEQEEKLDPQQEAELEAHWQQRRKELMKEKEEEEMAREKALLSIPQQREDEQKEQKQAKEEGKSSGKQFKEPASMLRKSRISTMKKKIYKGEKPEVKSQGEVAAIGE